MKLSTIISLAFIVTAIILAIGGSAYQYSESNKLLKGHVERKLEAIAESRTEHIQTYLDQNVEILKLITSRSKLRDTLKQYNEDPSSDKIDAMLRILEDAKDPIEEIERICVFGLDGNVIASTNNDFCGDDILNKTFFITGKEINQVHFAKDGDGYKIFVSGPFVLDGNLIGVGMMVIGLDYFESILFDRTGLLETGEVLAGIDIGGEKSFLSKSRFESENFGVQEEYFTGASMKEALGKNEGIYYIKDYRNVFVIAVTRYIDLSFEGNKEVLGIVSKIDEEEALGTQRIILLKVAVYMILLLIIIALVVSYFLSRFISRSLSRLTSDVDEITKGKLDIQLSSSDIFEVQNLTDSLNRILASLKLAILKTGVSKSELGIGEAVEAKEKAESALERKEKETQTILDAIPAWVFYKDKENRFLRVNKAFADVMKLPKEKLEGKSCSDLYPKAQAEAFWKDDKEVIASGKSKIGIIESMDSPNGKVWVKTDKILYRDDKGEVIGIIGFSVDISEQKKLEEKLKVGVKKVARKKVNKSVGKK